MSWGKDEAEGNVDCQKYDQVDERRQGREK